MTGPTPDPDHGADRGAGSAPVVDTVRSALVDAFGTEPDEASITFLGAPPVRVLRFVGADPGAVVAYATLGCSAAPMGDPSAIVPDPDGPRAELLAELRGGVDGIARALAVLASTPAMEGVILAEGAILDTGEPLWPGSSCTGVVLRPSAIGSVDVGPGSAPVTILRAVPVTPTEAAWARVRGVGALEEAWAEASIDVTDPGRPAAAPR